MPTVLSTEQVARYHDDGSVLLRGLFDAEEVDLLRRAAREDHPGEGIYGTFARCERIVRSAECLLGGEVYHDHSRMIMRSTGGCCTPRRRKEGLPLGPIGKLASRASS